MKRISAYVGVLLLVFAVAVGGARLVGTSQPVAFAILFTNPDGSPCIRPCLLGIRPGETQFTEAIKRLQIHPFTRGMQLSDNTNKDGKVFKPTDGSPLLLNISRDANGIVDFIVLETEATPSLFGNAQPMKIPPSFNASLGQVVTVLGNPDYFQLADDDQGRKINYSYYDHIEIVTKRSVVRYVNIADTLIYLYIQAQPSDKRADMHSWIGFRNLRRYFDLAAHG